MSTIKFAKVDELQNQMLGNPGRKCFAGRNVEDGKQKYATKLLSSHFNGAFHNVFTLIYRKCVIEYSLYESKRSKFVSKGNMIV